ncbi:S8 family serine peptidase [Lutibacter sp.]|uniref:S8 family serine peptidase n=1 Tax=Lutibacter sp. TaxID=1925666 RepID=UPI0034A0A652
MKNTIFTFLFLFSISSVFSQVEDAWVYFKDKPNEASFYGAPLTMLSQRSLDRRVRYNIALDIKDVPIESTYISAIENASGITVLAKSKWLNALHIQGTKNDIDALLNLELANFLIVESIEFANRSLNGSKPVISSREFPEIKKKHLETTTDFTYGNAENQLLMLGGTTLHQNNFTGAGMQIAVLDAGFPNVNTMLAFKRIRENGQILGGYDFVERSTNFYGGNSHGTSVLSTIVGYLEDGVNGATKSFVGTAPDANFYLFRTENSPVEVKLEESLWVEAAEKADSLGVDVINTSLGYSVFFDNPDHNYNYSDMDGKTTFISRGAEIAFSRGMILVNSAGNEGNDSAWPYINAPADAPSVLTVGAVNASGNIATFSSFGPTSDNRIKPDVCAQGQATALINTSGSVVTGNGTSFSSPVLAGVVACLWQALPDKTNAEITQLIKESAHLFPSSTNQEGYGIPNFKSIFEANFVDDNDIDGDGIENSVDLCPNSPIGTVVDETGCFYMPSNNFNIEVISETCIDKNNGKINISATIPYNYTASINGTNYLFTNENALSLTNLAVGAYEICISIENQDFNQCYNVNVAQGETVSGKVEVTSKSALIALYKGTPPFTIYLNGIEKIKTLNKTFELPVKRGDLIEVKTSVTCEGVLSKEINFENLVSLYPNPISNVVNFNFPIDITGINVTIYNVLGSVIFESKILESNPKADISSIVKGLYILQVTYNNELLAFKILKN